MTPAPLVETHALTKVFRRYPHARARLLEWATLGLVTRHESFLALQPITLAVAPGECLGVIGENGAGKSTLLKLIAGVLHPSDGRVIARGRVVSLLELGTGFHPELDGIANIRQSARLLGVGPAELDGRLDAILAFAELGDFVHQPLRTYSSGMYVRLAFALFAHLDPEVYIVDEALSVGDVFFQQKCFTFLEALKARGAAILFASHDMPAVLRLASRALLLERGATIALGDPVEIVNLYYSRHGSRFAGAGAPSAAVAPVRGDVVVPAAARLNADALAARRGTGTVQLEGARFLTKDRAATQVVRQNDEIVLQLFARAHADVDDLTFGFQVTDRLNTVVFGQTLYLRDRTRLRARTGELLQVEFEFPAALGEGRYAFSVGATDCQLQVARQVYDHVERALVLEVRPSPEPRGHGLVLLPTRVRVIRAGAAG